MGVSEPWVVGTHEPCVQNHCIDCQLITWTHEPCVPTFMVCQNFFGEAKASKAR